MLYMDQINMLGDEPPYLSVGTEVSAKYKGAFCEAKVRKVDRVVKCKIAYKLGFGSHTVLDNQVKGVLRVGAIVEARHPEKKEFIEGTITKIQDCSQYTVVFDDGDITTLRRSALCLKSGRHFAESETLDQLPLTHPEHFGNPVVGGRRGSRRRGGDDSSGDEERPRKKKPPAEREAEIGKVVCVELGDKKKVKDNWFPGLVVAPTAQDTVRIRVKEEYLVRSFKDGRYYTVPKKEATEFTREIGQKVDNHTLKTAVEKALTFLDKDELPPHWDRELLFGLLDSDGSDSDAGMESDSSDGEPREEKDHFVARLYKFMDDRGTPINSCPSVCSQDLDLYKLFKVVRNLNGYNRVSNQNQWKMVSAKLGIGTSPGIVTQVKHAYKKFLHSFEDFNRKLGCTMVSHPRSGRSRMKGGRALIRDKDKATPVNTKGEPSNTSKAEDDKESKGDSAVQSAEQKRMVTKEETPRSRVKPEEVISKEVDVKEEPSANLHPTRPMSSLRKKFPALKASPRTKETLTPTPTPAQVPLKRMPSQRHKKNTQESVDEGKVVDEEPIRPVKPPEEQQRSTTRSKSKEELKVPLKKEPLELNKCIKPPLKSSEPEPVKKIKAVGEELKKGKEIEKKSKRGGSDDSASGGSATSTSVCGPAGVCAANLAAIKKNRKRRNTDVTSDGTGKRPCIPQSRSVIVGDILKVYYGSPADPNGIYEAKVIDIEKDESGEQMFLVHYAGWNSRYDEWVKRSKIAENLSRTVRKVKSSATKNVKTALKKKTAPGVGKIEPARSTTPSSITSSSSRTKSPATPMSLPRRSKRPETSSIQGAFMGRRLRRTSGHTDVSLDTDSDSESINSESDSEVKPDKSASDAASASDDSRNRESKKIAMKPAVRRRIIKKTVCEVSESTSENVDKKKPRLSKPKQEKEVKEEIKQEEVRDADLKVESNQDDGPKGTEFDLNEIRSELKGIDKAVKVNSEPQVPSENEAVASGSNTGQLDVRLSPATEELKTEEVLLIVLDSPVHVIEEPIKEEEVTPLKPVIQEQAMVLEEDIKEDIYEFKEPEPFDFQDVRRPIRLFDEPERSPEKIVTPKKSVVASTIAKVEKKEAAPLDIDSKSRFRKTLSKKMKDVTLEKNEECDELLKIEEDKYFVDEDELPELEIEELPPPLLTVPTVELELSDEEIASPPRPHHKSSPEPPCLEPVMETTPCQPPEHSPILTREDPPQLNSEMSSSDSEADDERLVIVNEEESTSNDPKTDAQPPPPPPPLPLELLPSLPPPLLTEERQEVHRSPLSEVRLKRVEERLKTPPALFSEPQSPKTLIVPEVLQDDVQKEQVAEIKEEEVDNDDGDGETSMRSLICDEVIPGSPAPKDPGEELAFPAQSASGVGAAAVMENTPPTTPPTTPESNMSSPRDDRVGSSSLDNESPKDLRDSCERDTELEAQRNRAIKYGKRCEKEPIDSPPKKRRRSRKRSESTGDCVKRALGRGARGKLRDARDSDSDDTSDNSLGRHISSDPLLSNRSPRPSKYNFCKELAPDLDANQRICYLQNQMQELRKAYINIKSQLASIDRRRKKLRRKEREEKAAAAAAAAAAEASIA